MKRITIDNIEKTLKPGERFKITKTALTHFGYNGGTGDRERERAKLVARTGLAVIAVLDGDIFLAEGLGGIAERICNKNSPK